MASLNNFGHRAVMSKMRHKFEIMRHVVQSSLITTSYNEKVAISSHSFTSSLKRINDNVSIVSL